MRQQDKVKEDGHMVEKWIAVLEVDDQWTAGALIEDLTNRNTDIRVLNVRRTKDSPTTTHACAECGYVHLPADAGDKVGARVRVRGGQW